ncbi:MAG: hypothetical protein WCY67_05505 [Acidithiobacillus sp.]
MVVLGITAAVYTILHQEKTKTAAAPYAFHMVHMTKPAQKAPDLAHAPSQKSPRPVPNKPSATTAQVHQVTAPLDNKPTSRRTSSPEKSQEAQLDNAQFRILTSRQRARLISRYVTYWIEHVEQEASGQIQNQNSGKIRVRVTVISTGHLAGLALLQSTMPGTESSRVVDLIRAASPYAPFPKNLAKAANKLIIHSTIQFIAEGSGATTVNSPNKRGKTDQKNSLGGSLSQALLGGAS